MAAASASVLPLHDVKITKIPGLSAMIVNIGAGVIIVA
jgi:hypothetical protein